MRRLPRLTDFSIPLGLAGIMLIAWFWGWRLALIVVLVIVGIGVAGILLPLPWQERLRGTTMDVGDRPMLIYLYSPY